MNIKKILRNFVFLFAAANSMAFLKAARIVFYNETDYPVSILYNNVCMEIGRRGCGKDSCEVLASRIKRLTPFVRKEIVPLEFKFKVGDNANFQTYKMKNFEEPYSRESRKVAVFGDFTRNFYIRNKEIKEIDEELVGVEEEIIEDEGKFLERKAKEIVAFTSRVVKGGFSSYGTIGKNERISVDKWDPLKGAIPIEGSDEDSSIRNLSFPASNQDRNPSIACDREIFAAKQREERVKEAQNRFFNDQRAGKFERMEKFDEDELPLCIAIAGSGGGVRARISTTGFVKGAMDAGVFDCVTYFSALSGSSWMLGPWIIRDEKKVSNIDDFINVVVKGASNARISETHSLPQIDWDDIKKNYYYQKAWDRPHGLVNIFGTVLQKTFLEDVNEDCKQLYLSGVREKVENGECVIPIFEVRAEKKRKGKPIIHEPCFFTPWEFGGRYFGKKGACINIKTFGAKFQQKAGIYEFVRHDIENKVNTELEYRGEELIGPEPDMGLIMGICGSAFTVPVSTVRDGIAQQNIDQRYTLKSSVFNNSVFNCEFNNFMEGKLGFDGYKDSKLLYLHDAGIVANIPVISLYRRQMDIANGIKEGAAPDIIFVFDASDTSRGEVGEELLYNQKEMLEKGLAFPKIKEKIVEIDNKGTKIQRKQLDAEIIQEIKRTGFYIFDENPDKGKFKDWEVPTVIYMTLVPGARNGDFIFSFNDFGTFKFKYTENECRGLIGLTAGIFEKNKNKIRRAMIKRRIINMERHINALKAIAKSPNIKQESIMELIELKKDCIVSLKKEQEKLNVELLGLNEKKKGLYGRLSGTDLENKKLYAETNKINKKLHFKYISLEQAKKFIERNESIIGSEGAVKRIDRLDDARIAISEHIGEAVRINKKALRNKKLKYFINLPEFISYIDNLEKALKKKAKEGFFFVSYFGYPRKVAIFMDRDELFPKKLQMTIIRDLKIEKNCFCDFDTVVSWINFKMKRIKSNEDIKLPENFETKVNGVIRDINELRKQLGVENFLSMISYLSKKIVKQREGRELKISKSITRAIKADLRKSFVENLEENDLALWANKKRKKFLRDKYENFRLRFEKDDFLKNFETVLGGSLT